MRASPKTIDLKRSALSNQAGKRHNYRRGNPQRRVLMEQLVKGKSVTEAAKIAGYSCPQAASNALRAMRGELVEALRKSGWGPAEFVTKHFVPMLQRKKVLYFANQGIVTDKRVVEDTEAQQRAGEMYAKIFGLYAPVEVEHSGTIYHELTETEKKEARESLERIRAFEVEGERKLLTENVEE